MLDSVPENRLAKIKANVQLYVFIGWDNMGVTLKHSFFRVNSVGRLFFRYYVDNMWNTI